MRIQELLDNRNRALYEEMSSRMNLQVIVAPVSCYRYYSKGSIHRIDVPKFKPASSSSFAHELLHAQLDAKGAYISFKAEVSESALLSRYLSMNLCDHLSNVLLHRKMFPIFLAMGYPEADFLSDSLERILSETEAHELAEKIASRASADVDYFIGKYLSTRCSMFSYYDYSKPLDILRSAEPRLTEIMEELVERWDVYNPDNEGDIEADSHFLISHAFLESMEEWLKSVVKS